MQLKPGIFITGTDTGVGKTIVSATLSRLLRMRGVNVGVIKPATSGCRVEDGQLVSDDALLLCQAAGVPCNRDTAPYLLTEPLAPAEAARIDGVEVAFSHILACQERLAAQHDFLIMEGAGGLMVPLSGTQTVADLAKLSGLPLLVVARPNLGTINHAALTCLVAKQMGITVIGVIINNYPQQAGLAEQSAAGYIEVLGGAPVLGIWPHQDTQSEFEAVEALAEWLNGRSDTDDLLKLLGC